MNGIREIEVADLTDDEAETLQDRADALHEWVEDQIAQGYSQSDTFAAILFYGRIIYDAQRGTMQ